MKTSKQNYYSKYFESNLTNIKNTWKGIKSIISMRSSSSVTPTLLTFQNETIDNLKRIANIFNNDFSTISKKTQAKIKYSYKKCTDYLTNENPNSFFLSPKDKEEIKLILSSLVISKPTGPYSIPTKVLKLLKNDIFDQFADLINVSFTTGSFPTTTQVIPIHKKESKFDYNNYHPISLLSNLDKILGKLMHNRLYMFLNDDNIIYPLQFGFRQKYFTSFALIHLTETIKEALDQGKYCCGVFLDLQKAIDTANHNTLKGKLKHYGIRGVAYSWFESYLKGRKQHVSVNGFNSKDLPISYSVPQGSVLGLLLFLLYINDLHTAIKFCKVHHFADDTYLLHISKSIKELNKFVNFQT